MPIYACRVCGDPENPCILVNNAPVMPEPPEQCPWNKPDGAPEAIPEWRELKEGT
jgi:hypothetical protein